MQSRVVEHPGISIVLLTRDGAQTIAAVLDAIDQQLTDVPFEVIAVDSGSIDGTRAILEPRVHRMVTIEPEAFNHGATRNLAVSHARAELVVLLVQDAVPVSREWLRSLVAPFASDAALAGTFSRQVPAANASALTRLYMQRWFANRSQPRRVAVRDADLLDQLSPAEQLDLCTFDNVCSCIRRSVWSTHPFAETPIAEDIEWARTVLRSGHALAYTPESVVAHSHDRSATYEFARTYTLHRRLFELLRVQTIPSLPTLFRAVVSSARLHFECTRHAEPREPVGAAIRALALAVAWPAGQYLGALSAAKGWRALKFRGV